MPLALPLSGDAAIDDRPRDHRHRHQQDDIALCDPIKAEAVGQERARPQATDDNQAGIGNKGKRHQTLQVAIAQHAAQTAPDVFQVGILRRPAAHAATGHNRDHQRAGNQHGNADARHCRAPAKQFRGQRQRGRGGNVANAANRDNQTGKLGETVGEPVGKGNQRAAEDPADANADQQPADGHQAKAGRGGNAPGAQNRQHHQSRDQHPDAKTIGQDADRNLHQRNAGKEGRRQQPQPVGANANVGGNVGRKHRVGGTEEVAEDKGRHQQPGRHRRPPARRRGPCSRRCARFFRHAACTSDQINPASGEDGSAYFLRGMRPAR